ncbi:response regulator transcription factor [Halopseudomonas salegens]|uniref:Two component transcriptional regulator, AraC family n=1 Tax=Halopseudomonas salegens TaxID=1434072 RepID=A0A1H2HEB0_9GAMM|nr:DNA-binding response regulator [Halopseudomonas salegens]SDU30251.1 two component transcriptional regulator, AraC family [Halopseudomonas salegens]
MNNNKPNAHVLIIDDQPEALGSLMALLRAEGMRISIVTEARRALDRTIALWPDLVLLDVHMPDLDGFALCRLLRESPTTRDLPVIFLTAAASAEERLNGLSLGSVDYVTKPFLPEEVLARIRIHLQLVKRNYSAPTLSDAPHDPEQVILNAALRLIGNELASPPSLAEIARRVGTYEKRLSAIFRERMGTSVFAFIREERLHKSQELLTDTAMSMQDIADLVGFSSAANFTTAFRERLGMTPSVFRASARTRHADN